MGHELYIFYEYVTVIQSFHKYSQIYIAIIFTIVNIVTSKERVPLNLSPAFGTIALSIVYHYTRHWYRIAGVILCWLRHFCDIFQRSHVSPTGLSPESTSLHSVHISC